MSCKKYETNRNNTQQTKNNRIKKKKHVEKRPSKLVAHTCVQPIETYPLIC
jgi:hypothetical protein